MQAKKTLKQEREQLWDSLWQLAREGLLLVLVGLCAFVLLVLFTFDPGDPGWSHLGWNSKTLNAGGNLGAWMADILLALFGVSAFLLPVIVVGKAYWILKFWKAPNWASGLMLTLRVSGLLALLASVASLAALHLDNSQLRYPYTAGGLLGQNLAPQLLYYLDLLGSNILLTLTTMLGISLLTNFSWLDLCERLGKGVYALSQLWQQAPSAKEKARDSDYIKLDSSEIDTLWNQASAPPAKDIPVLDDILDSDTQRPGKTEPRFNLDEPSLTMAVQPQPTLDDKLSPHMGESLNDTPDEPDANSLSWRERPIAAEEVEAALNWQPQAKPRVSSPPPQVTLEPAPAPAPAPAPENSLPHRPLSISPLGRQLDVEDEELAHTAPTTPMRVALSTIPSLEVLDPADNNKNIGYSAEKLEEMSALLEAKLLDFGVKIEVVAVNPGPVITRFEVHPAPGVKASKITNLAKDLARSLAVMSVRVVEVIAGKSVIGIEIPNDKRAMVRLREVLQDDIFQHSKSPLPLALGHDIGGFPVVANLAKMPHLLVAGTTGSGKSVGVNAMILSLLYKCTPEQVRLIMVDPKMLELSIYDGIPHLLCPVITDMKEAAGALRWCVGEMERRYRLMASAGVRNLEGYNRKLEEMAARGEYLPDPLWKAEESLETEPPILEPLPYIVVIIDEFADMMMMVGKKVEELIARIAQKARAAGIHLILATQRPSVDVITGLIKANVPSRIAFQVSSKIDSRTILDQGGAESLLGNGDMLYLPIGTSIPVRVHGAFVADDEVHRTVEEWKLRGEPDYIDDILNTPEEGSGPVDTAGNYEEEQDPLYDEAVAFVIESRRASISAVQRKLKIGYNRAARMIEAMEAAGVVSSPNHSGNREVMVPNAKEY